MKCTSHKHSMVRVKEYLTGNNLIKRGYMVDDDKIFIPSNMVVKETNPSVDRCITNINYKNKFPVKIIEVTNGYFIVKDVGNEQTLEIDCKSSTMLQNVTYCTDTSEMVVYINSKKYVYVNVPREVFDKFKHAESLGKFFNEYIRGNYGFDFGVKHA